MNSWLKFIENPEVVKMDENAELKKAKKELEKISNDEHERYLAELREKYILDQKSIESAGYNKGKKAGIEERYKRRRKNRKKRSCKKIISARYRY